MSLSYILLFLYLTSPVPCLISFYPSVSCLLFLCLISGCPAVSGPHGMLSLCLKHICHSTSCLMSLCLTLYYPSVSCLNVSIWLSCCIMSVIPLSNFCYPLSLIWLVVCLTAPLSHVSLFLFLMTLCLMPYCPSVSHFTVPSFCLLSLCLLSRCSLFYVLLLLCLMSHYASVSCFAIPLSHLSLCLCLTPC